ncbi:hypothetical protein GCM10009679_09690 [Saccharothrix algeriensis]|uniref:Uncharacterized protein n=1 Tax=Catellatospora bangladeshensis TaxID=310355 RepID=A0A8J3JKP6_9ACTN|nr:hypothetical protein Cba03nite_36160 [Catellatospora bangladeshensis]
MTAAAASASADMTQKGVFCAASGIWPIVSTKSVSAIMESAVGTAATRRHAGTPTTDSGVTKPSSGFTAAGK